MMDNAVSAPTGAVVSFESVALIWNAGVLTMAVVNLEGSLDLKLSNTKVGLCGISRKVLIPIQY